MPKKTAKKATAADAEIVMKLYDLRRETEMRKARNWFASTQLQTFDDLVKIAMAYGTQENAWYRQVLTYWENAASLVLRGVVNPDLFMDWNGEMIFMFVKVKPFLKQAREFGKSQEYMAKVETLLNSTPELRKKVAEMEKRMAEWREMQAKTAKA